MTFYYEYESPIDGELRRFISVGIPMEDKDLVRVLQVILAEREKAAIETERWKDAKRYSDTLTGIAEALIKAKG